VDPDGSSARFRRHPRFAPARACELRVGRRGWPLSTHPKGVAVTSLGGPLPPADPGGLHLEALLDTFHRSVQPNLPLRLRGASGGDFPAGRSFVPEAGACALTPRTKSRPSPSFRIGPRLNAAFWFQSSRAPASTSLSSACAPRRSREIPGLRIPEPNSARFPEGTSTVSGPCKLLILLWFPAAGPSRLQS
jgi:hypothetical protein